MPVLTIKKRKMKGVSLETIPARDGPVSAPSMLVRRSGRLQGLVRNVPWLSDLDDADVDALLRGARIHALQTSEWLYEQDTPADWLYIVINGAMRLVRKTHQGRQATIRCVERGGPLGHLSMVAIPSVYLYSAQTLRKSQLLAISAQQSRQLMDRNPKCRAIFMSRLAVELTNRLEDLALMTQGDAMVRLVSYLLRELTDAESSEPRVVRLTIPKRWLASQLAMTPETLSRSLSKLRESGAITVEGQRIEVLSEQQLRDIMLSAE
ncbi:Crp/Fnr family transcriptional regulator [Halomonas halocynthiae]|uniref:Crp/Fnr family transcriptional regulator n=1 Tax=Halomonas halocynthiae TaxID=176290 RepID=UPI001F0A3CCC|nr:Crp/Fnr family transcriptional regulator [Halomonas halocynthiae]